MYWQVVRRANLSALPAPGCLSMIQEVSSLLLKRVGVDSDRTIQDLMHEAVDDLLVKYGKHAFGKR